MNVMYFINENVWVRKLADTEQSKGFINPGNVVSASVLIQFRKEVFLDSADHGVFDQRGKMVRDWEG